MVSSFSSAASQNMTCFVAGTLVMTASGLMAIEKIKAGDRVLSADPETMQTGYKSVLETYIREVDRLIHLTVNGEEIVTTYDHPFYVKDKGFINAEQLWIGAELVDNNGNTLLVEKIYREELDNEIVTVYNFQVDEYHTYFVGERGIWVHNANYPSNRDKYMGKTPSKKSKVGQEVIDRMRYEGRIREGANGLEFKAGDGNWYSLDRADMAHIKDAISWWNEEGRNYGAKSSEVRAFMKDPNNYELELDSINRSQGPHNQTYLPPNK